MARCEAFKSLVGVSLSPVCGTVTDIKLLPGSPTMDSRGAGGRGSGRGTRGVGISMVPGNKEATVLEVKYTPFYLTTMGG